MTEDYKPYAIRKKEARAQAGPSAKLSEPSAPGLTAHWTR
jgi:hypothetical protein